VNTQDIFFLFIVFSIIKKLESETVFQFKARFSRFYNRIPNTARANEADALIYYFEAFDGIFGIFLESKEPQTLEEAQAPAIMLGGHFLAAYGFLPLHDFQPLVATEVQEILDIEDKPQLAPCQIPRDK
jgi:hypothetical protein